MGTQTLVKEICPTSTQKRISEGALLVDVCDPDEVAELSCDVPAVMYIPLREFEARYKEIPKDRKVVMVCRTGERSLRAAGFLVNHGYDQVVNMQFGIIRWALKGFPTKGDKSSVLQKNKDCCSGPACS